MNSEIQLKPIDHKTLKPVLKLVVGEGEEKFVAPNAISMAQAYIEPRTYPTAIYAGGTAVGFMWYGQFAEDKGDWWLCRLMIDKTHRRKGYAEAALNLVVDKLRDRGVDKLYLSVVPKNLNAIKLYAKTGFTATGKVLDGEHEYLLKIES